MSADYKMLQESIEQNQKANANVNANANPNISVDTNDNNDEAPDETQKHTKKSTSLHKRMSTTSLNTRNIRKRNDLDATTNTATVETKSRNEGTRTIRITSTVQGSNKPFRNIIKLLVFTGFILIAAVSIGLIDRNFIDRIFSAISRFFSNDNRPLRPSSDDLLETCIPPTFRHSQHPCIPYERLTYCDVENLEGIPKSQLASPLLRMDDKFANTPLHFFIAHHNNNMVSWVLKKFPELKNELLTAKDKNGCTALLLAGKIGAPSSVIRQLITHANAVMADNNGITPLMLAARGQDPRITRMILQTIGNRLANEMQRRDSSGKTVADWGDMHPKAMWDEFLKVDVDAAKAANHCYNTLCVGTNHQPIVKSHHTNKITELGFELGPHFYNGNTFYALRATKANAQKLLEMATNKGPSANESRKEVGKLLWDEDNVENLNKMWRGIEKEMRKVTSQICEDPFVQVYKFNQRENKRIITEAYKKPVPGWS